MKIPTTSKILVGTGISIMLVRAIKQSIDNCFAEQLIKDSQLTNNNQHTSQLTGLGFPDTISNQLEQEIRFKVELAFRNIGIDWPVYVVFDYHSAKESFNAFTFNFFRHKQKLSIVVISSPKSVNPNLIYALAGHEAAHCLREHDFGYAMLLGGLLPLICNRLWKAYTKEQSLMLVLEVILIELFFMIISQLKEIDADLCSTKRLGTGLRLADYLEALPSSPLSWISSHPSPHVRAYIIKKWGTSNSHSIRLPTQRQQLIHTSIFSNSLNLIPKIILSSGGVSKNKLFN